VSEEERVVVIFHSKVGKFNMKYPAINIRRKKYLGDVGFY